MTSFLTDEWPPQNFGDYVDGLAFANKRYALTCFSVTHASLCTFRGASKEAYALVAQSLLGGKASDAYTGHQKRDAGKNDPTTYPLPANIANLSTLQNVTFNRAYKSFLLL